MALIPCLLFLSLLSHSILLAKCDLEDDLLNGINVYRRLLNLTVLNVTKGTDCLADEVADSFKNKTCTTNTTTPNTTTLSSFSGYHTLLAKCGLDSTNTTVNGQILPACVPDQQSNLVLSNFISKYATYLNSTHFSVIGIGSEDDWIVVVLTNMTGGVSNGASVPTTSNPFGYTEDDDLLKGINLYRTTLNLTVLNVTKGTDCLADEIADSFKNKTCTTNTTSPNTTTLSSFAGYHALLAKCGLNSTKTTVNGQILPACVPDQQSNLVLSNFTSKYATYLNSTHFSAIGIGSEDDWIVVVLTGGVSNGTSVPTTSNPNGYTEDDDLLKGINLYRTALNLTVLNVTKGTDCLADEIADSFKNKTCTTNTTSPNTTTLSSFAGYHALLAKCGLNSTHTTVNGQILPACVPDQQSNLVLSNFISKYATYLNSTHFSAIGIGSEDDLIVVILTNMTSGVSNGASAPTTSNPNGYTEDDDLLKGINLYRTALNLTVLNVTKGTDCLADEIADSFKNKTCTTNTTSPNTTTLSSFAGYHALLAKCGLNSTKTTVKGQILPACVPDQQSNLVLSNFTSKYATYLNSTHFSAIGIGSEDDWIVVVLTSGVSNRDSVLTTIGPVMFSLICLFMLV